MSNSLVSSHCSSTPCTAVHRQQSCFALRSNRTRLAPTPCTPGSESSRRSTPSHSKPVVVRTTLGSLLSREQSRSPRSLLLFVHNRRLSIRLRLASGSGDPSRQEGCVPVALTRTARLVSRSSLFGHSRFRRFSCRLLLFLRSTLKLERERRTSSGLRHGCSSATSLLPWSFPRFTRPSAFRPLQVDRSSLLENDPEFQLFVLTI